LVQNGENVRLEVLVSVSKIIEASNSEDSEPELMMSEKPVKPVLLSDEDTIKAQKKLKKREQKQVLSKMIQKEIFASLPKIAELAKAMVLDELEKEKVSEEEKNPIIETPTIPVST